MAAPLLLGSPTPPSRRSRQPTQDVGQDPAVTPVAQLVLGIDPA